MPNTERDRMAKTLGLETLEYKFGVAKVRGKAEEKFLNGVDIAHGGFLFTVADFASALAANADGRVAISSGASINYLSPCPANETVEAVASISYSDEKTALCDVAIKSAESGKIFAIFQSRMIFKKR